MESNGRNYEVKSSTPFKPQDDLIFFTHHLQGGCRARAQKKAERLLGLAE
jgi:hypothetical protein